MGSDSAKKYNAGGRTDAFLFDPENLVIVADKKHPLYDERVEWPVDEALVLNIMVNGVIEPIIFRVNGEKNGHSICEVVDGRQRVRAAIEANRRLAKQGLSVMRVTGMLKKGEVANLVGVMIAANELRRPDDQIVRARKMQRYIDGGRTEDEAAVQFGVSRATVKNMLSILDLTPEVQKEIEKGNLPATVGKELSKIPQEEQADALKQLVESGNIRGVRGVQAAKNVRKGKGAVASSPRIPPKAQERIQAALSNGETADLKKLPDSLVAQAGAAMLAYLDGDKKAFNRWPKVKEIIEAALEKPKKEKGTKETK